MPRFGVYTDVSAANANLETRLASISALIAAGFSSWIDVTNSTYAADKTGVADSYAAINSAMAAAALTKARTLYFPGGTYKSSATLANTTPGMRFVGDGFGRPSQDGGTRISFTGTGPVIRQGSSKVSNTTLYDPTYAAGDYDGVQGLTLQDIGFEYGGASTTPLLNGYNANTYGTGTFGVQDWRGGGVKMTNVAFEHFGYAFWGIQSDINEFNNVNLFYCSVGAYLGPRSDQNTMARVFTLGCDIDLWLDGNQGFRAHNCQFTGGGSATTPAIRVGTQYAGQPCQQPVFRDCWFEHYEGYSAAALPAFVELGVAPYNVSTVDDPLFDNITISANLYASPPSINRLFRVGNVQRMEVHNVGGMADRINTLVDFVGASSPEVLWRQNGTTNVQARWTNSGSGSPKVHALEWNSGQMMASGNPGRFWVRQSPYDANKDFYLSCENQNGSFNVVFPNDGSGNTARIALNRRIKTQGGIPSTGTWTTGDWSWESAPAVGKAGVYVCTASGSPGTWVRGYVLPGSSADRGDTSQTLTVGTDAPTQRWDTALTANRTITLSTTGAVNGDKFRVVRTGLGAFTLDVGGLKTIPSATAAFVDVEFNGTAWKLAGYGAL